MRMQSRYLMVFLLFLPCTSHGTVVEEMDLQALFLQADAAVSGVVEETQSRFISGRIITTVRVRTEDRWGMETGTEKPIEIQIPGGQVGELAQKVVGAPIPVSGEQVFLFLHRSRKAPRTYVVLGLSQGYFRIAKSRDGPMASRDQSELIVVRADGTTEHGARETVPVESLRKMALERFSDVPGRGGRLQPW